MYIMYTTFMHFIRYYHLVFTGKSNPRGFSLVSTLIAVSIVGTSLLTLVSMMVEQEKGTKILRQQVASANLKSFLTKVFVSSEVCGCHFDATQNTPLPPSSFNIDTTVPTPSEINLESLRSSCDFSSADNIIAEVEKEISGGLGLTVNSIKISEIHPTGTEGRYSGHLIVNYENQGLPLRPTLMPLVLAIDLSSGTDSARPIQSCWGQRRRRRSFKWSWDLLHG